VARVDLSFLGLTMNLRKICLQSRLKYPLRTMCVRVAGGWLSGLSGPRVPRPKPSLRSRAPLLSVRVLFELQRVRITRVGNHEYFFAKTDFFNDANYFFN
jgi:hypothetical protein